MTGPQIARCNPAILAARAAVERAARETGMLDGSLPMFPTKGQRTAYGMIETMRAIEEVYRANLDDSSGPTPDSVVDEIVANARQLADPSFRELLDETPTNLGDVLPDLTSPLSDLKWIVLGVLGIALVTLYVRSK
jgi:hypothetical protein